MKSLYCRINVSVYIDFNGATPITLSIDTSQDFAFDRRWNIRIQQIACDSVCKGMCNADRFGRTFFSSFFKLILYSMLNKNMFVAPNGCLQYYKSISGSVSSFNYGTAVNPRGKYYKRI